MPATPNAEYHIDPALITQLLLEQCPDLSHMTLHEYMEGWDNVIMRLGDHLAVRLPRRAAAAQLILNEQSWLPQLAEHLPLRVPCPCFVGQPGHGYPWHWSVLPWMKGNPADIEEVHASQAPVFTSFLRCLHTSAPANAPQNLLRGVALQQRAAAVEERMHRLMLQTTLITAQIQQIWYSALQADIDVEPSWLHGDLHPRNILVQAGSITAIIDWGDITAGDCATDLAALWMLFDEAHIREQALAAYGPISAATLSRSKGWALLFGVMLLESGLIDNPRNAAIGANILRVLAQG